MTIKLYNVHCTYVCIIYVDYKEKAIIFHVIKYMYFHIHPHNTTTISEDFPSKQNLLDILYKYKLFKNNL